jgi:glutathione peroxidase
MRLLLDTFAALPGQPFALLLLPCDQFPSPLGLLRERVPPWLRLRRTSSDGLDRSDPDVAAADAVRRACAAHGLDSPALRVLARADVNGARASPVWTYLKAAYGDTSDIGWNFGKFVVARDGNVVGRYCPPLRPALLVRFARLSGKPLGTCARALRLSLRCCADAGRCGACVWPGCGD